MKTDRVLEAVKRERAFQDTRWGTPQQNLHTLEEWIGLIEEELWEAMDAQEHGDIWNTLREILQAVAVGVACLEQYGLAEREEAST